MQMEGEYIQMLILAFQDTALGFAVAGGRETEPKYSVTVINSPSSPTFNASKIRAMHHCLTISFSLCSLQIFYMRPGYSFCHH